MDVESSPDCSCSKRGGLLGCLSWQSCSEVPAAQLIVYHHLEYCVELCYWRLNSRLILRTRIIIEIRMLQEDQLPICCRPSFKQNEYLPEAESKILQYKNYCFPYDQEREHQLKKAMCGMLNTEGGIILIGIKETPEKKRIVMKSIYPEDIKENILTYFRLLAKTLRPDHIILKQLIEVEFVPVQSFKSEQFIKGSYIIRIRIKRGEKTHIYFFSERNQDYYFFRTKNQTIRIKTEDIFQELKNRMQNPGTKKPESELHEGPCKKPQPGLPQYAKSGMDQVFPFKDKAPHDDGDKKVIPNGKGKPGDNAEKKSKIFAKTLHPLDSKPNSKKSSEQDSGVHGKTMGKFYGSPIKPHRKHEEDQLVYVLINFPSQDRRYLTNSEQDDDGIMITTSKTVPLSIVYSSVKEVGNLKRRFEIYKNTENKKALLIEVTNKLSFAQFTFKSSYDEWEKIESLTNDFCKTSGVKGIKVQKLQQIIEFPDKQASAQAFLFLSQGGIRPRFKN